MDHHVEDVITHGLIRADGIDAEQIIDGAIGRKGLTAAAPGSAATRRGRARFAWRGTS